MSESTGGGSAAAPPAAPAAGDTAAAPQPKPLDQSPRLRDGISADDALKELSARRGQRPPRRKQAAAPPTVTVDGQQIGETAAAALEPAARSGASDDPIQRLIENFRKPEVKPAAAPNGAAAQPTPDGGQSASGQPITLTVGGQAQQFTPEQLAGHVQMAADYTRKAQELATLNRQVTERAQALDQLLPIIIPEIQRQIAALDNQLGQNIDWQRLANENPAEYQRQDALWKSAQAERQRLGELAQLQNQENEQQRRQRLQQGHNELVKALPGWDDPAARGKLQSEMIRWGRAHGYADSELNQIYESRHVITLCKAMMCDRMLENVHTTAPVVPQVRQRGTPPPPPAQPQASEAESRFDQNPSLRNAASLLNARRRLNGQG